jgi:hypothetical protein
VGWKFDGTYQLLAYADDINSLGDNINIVKKNTKSLTEGSKDVGTELNVRKTEHMVMPCTRMQGNAMTYRRLCVLCLFFKL